MRWQPVRSDSLWSIVFGPLLWGAHFLLVYLPVAVWCEKQAGLGGSLLPMRLWIGGLTLVVLAAIAWLGITAFRKWGYGAGNRPPHEEDTLADRRTFMAYATVLLCGLSFIATLYVALPALMIETCS